MAVSTAVLAGAGGADAATGAGPVVEAAVMSAPSAVLQPGSSASLVVKDVGAVGRLYPVVSPQVKGAPVTLSLDAWSAYQQRFTVTASAGAPQGNYLVRLYRRPVRGATGQTPVVTADVVVAQPGSLLPYYNNSGIGIDRSGDGANFDGFGFSYSENELVTRGLRPGASFQAQGMTFQWPLDFPGRPDNILCNGQTVPVNGTGSVLGIVGAAINGPSRGYFIIHFSDGSEEVRIVGLSDWTLNGGHKKKPAYGNSVVAKMPYREANGASKFNKVWTYVFLTSVPLPPGKTVTSVTLPAFANQGSLHVFAMAVGG